jgi:DNA-binding GntR family transcriptional regulator
MTDVPASWRFPRTAEIPFRAVTKTDLAYAQIRQKILEGELAPETSLDQEALAEWLGLSTTPVREALRRLESERLVVVRAHRDTVVAPLSLETVEEVYAVRLSLDPLAAALAAARADGSDAERLAGLLPENPQILLPENPPTDDAVNAVYRNRHLHRAIYAASGNAVLVEMLDSLWDLSDRYRLVISKDYRALEVAGEEHAAIVTAVAGGEPDRASDLMREHLAGSLSRIRAAVSE